MTTYSRSRTQNNGIFPILCTIVALATACIFLAPMVVQLFSARAVFSEPEITSPVLLETGDILMPDLTAFEIDLAWALLPDPTFPSHALMRHGVEAVTASNCNQQNYELKFYNPETKRFAFFCRVDNLFGIHIFDDAMNEITSFIKNKMKRVDQVIQYMKNTGYELLQ